MKEITAIIRMNKIQRTNDALLNAGYPAITLVEVLGRGKQKGLRFEFVPALTGSDKLPKPSSVSFIPKRMITLVVEDKCCQKVVDLIIKANQTGNIGDGKIFISPVDDAVRVRTGDCGPAALL